MLDINLLKSNESLQGLTDEQLSVIAEMSKNDEEAQFSSRFAAIHNELDEMAKSVTGKGKKTNEKTSDYLRRTLTEMKEGLTVVDTLKAEKAELEQKIAEGLKPDEELKRQLEAKDATIADVRKQFNALKKQHDEVVENHKSELVNMRVDAMIANAMGGIKLKEGMNEAMMKMAKAEAIRSVKDSKPSFVDMGDGTERLIFHNADGSEMRDPENNLNHTTVETLLKKQFGTFGMLDDGSHSGGGAGGNGGGNGGNGGTLNLGGCRTKDDAMMAIEQTLKSRGLTRGSAAWQNETAKLWKENQTQIAQLD